MTQEHKEHNFHGLFFTILILVLVLIGGTRGHSQREEGRKISAEVAPAPASIPLPSPKSSALLVDAVQPVALAPSVSATAVLVQDIGGKKPIFELNSKKQWSAASLTKLLTALTASENLGPDQAIKVSPAAIATESSAGNLIAGQSYSLSELLRVLLVFSSNDAAAAIAEHFGKDNFVSLLNQKAAAIGMANTRFFDSHGLSPLNLTTAEDLMRLINKIYNERNYLFVMSQEKIEGATHPFAGAEDFLGGKTGFIDEAGGNLVSLFNYQGRSVVIVVLGSKQRAEDTQILKDWFLPQ